jgi:hypothetical protein
LSLEDTLDDLLFFDQKGTDDAAADTVATTGATISTVDGLLSLGDVVELTGTESLDTSQVVTTVTATRSLDGLLLVLVNQFGT